MPWTTYWKPGKPPIFGFLLASQGLYATGGVGSQVETIAGARWGGAVGSTLTYRIYAKYLDRDGEAFPDGTDAPDAWSRLQGGFRADAGLSQRDHVQVYSAR